MLKLQHLVAFCEPHICGRFQELQEHNANLH